MVTRRTRKLSEVVARDVVETIARRHLISGERLPSEAAMMEEYGVGRASLREALRILEVNELVQIRPGVGGGPVVGKVEPAALGRTLTLFLKMSGTTLGDVLRARLELEVALIPLVVQRSDRELDRLRSVVRRTAATDLHDDDEYVETTHAFHSAIASLSGNPVLELLCQALIEVFQSRMTAAVTSIEQRRTVIKEHEELAAAILGRDARRADALARAHLDYYISRVKERQPDLIDSRIEWE